MPLAHHEGLDVARQRFLALGHPFDKSIIARSAKYLGVFIGPDSIGVGWAEPLRKFQSAVRRWTCLPIGTHFTVK
eukprot:10243784-Prorocentrum_lima.AAC.1